MVKSLQSFLGVSATGFVLFFFSERLFWTAFRPGDSVGDLVVTWLAYSVLAAVFLRLVAGLSAQGAAALFVAGGVFGWLAEGVLVGTLYGTEPTAPFPLSILCTAFSWHALLSVLVGWHHLRRSLSECRPWAAVGWSVGLGAFWGLWATFLWRETPAVIVPVRAFAIHALACTLLLMLSYAAIHRWAPHRHPPGWLGIGCSLLVLGMFYAQQVRTLGWRPVVILPLLLGSALTLLRRARGMPGDAAPAPPLRWLPCLLAIPLTATSLYLFQVVAGLPGLPPTILFRGTILVAAGLLVWSVFTLLRASSRP